MSDLGGVWRTVGGRRIFIKDGEDLATAMKNSGKFNNEKTKEEKAEESVLIKQKRDEITKKIAKGGLSQEEYKKLKEEKDKLTEKKKQLDKDLTENDLKEARHRLEKKESEKQIPKVDLEKEQEDFNTLMKTNAQKIHSEIENELINIERFEDDYGISQIQIDEIQTETMLKIQNMHDKGEISDFVYEKYLDKINEETSNIMYKKGYEFYEHKGEIYYSMLPKAKIAYDEILNELDKRNTKYQISRSWNPGELPSIYVVDSDGNQFRISNHFNSKNQQFKAYSSEENKIYSTRDYINYKETVLKDLDEFLSINKE